jgi:trimethylamine:corrinoid methyltransferase-like protein
MLDTARTRVTLCEFIRKWTGVVCSPGPGEWSPTRVPGLFCTLEKAYFAMVAAAFSGYHPDIGVGHIEAGLAISPVQVLLDHEFTEGLKLLAPPPVTDEILGMDAILDIGFGFKDDYMAHPHTVKQMRSAAWIPRLFGCVIYRIFFEIDRP